MNDQNGKFRLKYRSPDGGERGEFDIELEPLSDQKSRLRRTKWLNRAVGALGALLISIGANYITYIYF